jgi:hypothetical protein
VGPATIQDAIEAFREEGYELSLNGELQPIVLDSLGGHQLTKALWAYVRRAKRGAIDAALVTGTGKDLLEATVAHILVERSGGDPTISNSPTMLGQAFVNLGLKTPLDPKKPDEPATCRVERAVYEAACAVNHLRNKEGTGHGRPWLPKVTDSEARLAVELMGVISEYLLNQHLKIPQYTQNLMCAYVGSRDRTEHFALTAKTN